MRALCLVSSLLISIFLSTSALAEEISITVKGMVCSFCAQGIKKTFSKNEIVHEIQVNLESKMVTIKTLVGKTISDEDLRRIINDAGYEVDSIRRAQHA
jgi:copper chaperone CopZ